MPSKLIQKSKVLVSAVAFSALLLTSSLLNAAPPQPDFVIEAIGEELLHPDRMGPVHAPVFASRGAQADPLASLKKEKERVLGELKKIASVDETGHLRAGGRIQDGKESEYIGLLQQHGNLCIELNYDEEMEAIKAENLSESAKISALLQNGAKYLGLLNLLSTTLPGKYDLWGWGEPFDQWQRQNSPHEDDNLLVLIGGKNYRKTLLSVQLLKKEMDSLPPLRAEQNPQYMRSPQRILEAIYTILGAETFDQAQDTLDHMVAWMSDFKALRETTHDDLRSLKLEKLNLSKENNSFMKRLKIFKEGGRLEEVDGAMVPYFKYLGLVPTSTEFLKFEPANVEAVESLMKESFVHKSQVLRAEIIAKERDFTLYEKITNYILDIEAYLSKKGRLS
ncbi:MAG: hypothetical protein B7Y25_00835 [Alphaproteobacteria bacterium 16-39-46]|nr:MAG: hypothetical protein B7Y25_00835 [Alphaproteobacteria bacterium 16-39-46]OZA44293.1 MAG: hypothetical protein B7X84_00965 [Alphaproteobacteria bacterium 17-39-52]HQS83477.1 hypothetical protein [Alphaproteobacteria bacterium]HQS93224.1 hypothetical protein [Alphaproteobacteria bacterium]